MESHWLNKKGESVTFTEGEVIVKKKELMKERPVSLDGHIIESPTRQ